MAKTWVDKYHSNVSFDERPSVSSRATKSSVNSRPNSNEYSNPGGRTNYQSQRQSQVTMSFQTVTKDEARRFVPSMGSTEHISDTRNQLFKIMSHPRFDNFIGIVILSNIGCMVAETNIKAACGIDKVCEEESWITVVNFMFLVFYTGEAVCRLYVWRWNAFKCRWTLLDFVIVFTGWCEGILALALAGETIPGPSLQLLRIFRILRLMRVARVLTAFPELSQMVRGFFGAMVAMFWGMVVIQALLLLWSIVAVEAISALKDRPREDPWCDEAFSSIEMCMLLLFQTIFAGDSWGYCGVPLIKAYPWTGIILAGALISISLGFTNLVLAVIVDQANKATQDDINSSIADKIKQRARANQELRVILQEIDSGGDGSISFEEAVTGFEENERLTATLSDIGVDAEDWIQFFSLLANDDGDVSIEELVHVIRGSTPEVMGKFMLLTSSFLTSLHNTVKDLDSSLFPLGKSRAGGRNNDKHYHKQYLQKVRHSKSMTAGRHSTGTIHSAISRIVLVQKGQKKDGPKKKRTEPQDLLREVHEQMEENKRKVVELLTEMSTIVKTMKAPSDITNEKNERNNGSLVPPESDNFNVSMAREYMSFAAQEQSIAPIEDQQNDVEEKGTVVEKANTDENAIENATTGVTEPAANEEPNSPKAEKRKKKKIGKEKSVSVTHDESMKSRGVPEGITKP